jgi:hypothetical protein
VEEVNEISEYGTKRKRKDSPLKQKDPEPKTQKHRKDVLNMAEASGSRTKNTKGT